MDNKSICRIGVFYDGTYFTYAQRHFYLERKLGWLDFNSLQSLMQDYVRSKEQGYSSYKVVYAAWFQGLFTAKDASEKNLHSDRNFHHDLLHAGIEAKFLPMSMKQREKGTDVALAVDAMEIGLSDKIDVAIIVSGDGDFVPLVRALMKNGVRVMIAHFCYEDEKDKSYISKRLLSACNYVLNINELESNKDFKSAFKGLFRKFEKKADVEHE